MASGTDDQYEELQRQKQELEQQKKEYESSNGDVEENIKYLKRMRDRIAECKNNVAKLTFSGYDPEDKKSGDSKFSDTAYWQGDVQKKYEELRKQELVYEINDYHKKLDEIQDSMNDKITELQNSKRDNDSCIGWIVNRLNEIYTSIQNWGN